MKIRKHRTQNLITYVLISVLLGFILVAIYIFILNGNRKKSFLISSIKQVESSVGVATSYETNRLKQIAFDYTFWDETVNYVHNKNISWAIDNLEPIITTYKIDFLFVIDTNYNRVYTITSEKYVDLKNIDINVNTLKKLTQERFMDFCYPSKYGLVQIHSATIHYTDDRERIGNPQGFFIIGKVLNDEYVRDLSLVTGTNIWTDTLPVANQLIKSKQGIAFSIPLYGQNSSTVAYFNVEKVYDFFEQYSKFTLQLIIVLFLSAIVVSIVLILVFSFLVNKPLKLVEQILTTDDVSKVEKLQNYGSEFAEIGNLINHTIDQKKDSRVFEKQSRGVGQT